MWVSIARRWMRLLPLFRVLFFGMLTLALYLGLRPSPTPAAYSWVSNVYHAGGLGMLMLLSYLGFPRWYWWARGLGIFALGAGIEYVQSFHPMRVADWNDLIANGIGVVTGLLIIMLLQWGGNRTERE